MSRSESVSFHVVSFEGPDAYSRAGGIATRVTGLVEALAELGHEAHLWFVGDPDLPGHELREDGVWLHRWCQWISRYHPRGVYDGEEGKRLDFSRSLPPFLLEAIRAQVAAGGRSVVLAEEWQTAEAVVALDAQLRRERLRERAILLWNANNTYSFDRIDWGRLAAAATITTVSRYMKLLMRLRLGGVDPVVVPNGLGHDELALPDRSEVRALKEAARGRTLLVKVARFDPDKRWLLAIRTLARLKELGWHPLLIARGGVEAHGGEVLAEAVRHGLSTVHRALDGGAAGGLAWAVAAADGADVLNVTSPIGPSQRPSLFASADAVLANSGHEPFGLVGLEAMAAGGLAFTGLTGEDYASPGENAVVLETEDPAECVGWLTRLRADPGLEHAVRTAGRATAERYAWPRVLERALLPRLGAAAARELPGPEPAHVAA